MSRRPAASASIHRVQQMFAAVSLPLCDDEPAIRAAADQQRSARNRELNSTKGTVAARAQAWFDAVDALLHKRQHLLDGVYQDFAGLAEAVLAASGRGGRRRLARHGREALLTLASSWCAAREDLARVWVERFLTERQLAMDLPPQSRGRSGSRSRTDAQAGVERTTARSRGQGATAPTTHTEPQGRPAAGRRGGLAVGVTVLALLIGLGVGFAGWPSLDDLASPGATARAADRQATPAEALGHPHPDEAVGQQAAPETTAAPSTAGPAAESASSASLVADTPATAPATPATPLDDAPSSGAPRTSTASRTDTPAGDESPLAVPRASEPVEAWTAWAIAPPTQLVEGQTLVLRLESDRLPDGELHELRLQGLTVDRVELNATRAEVRFDVAPLPADATAARVHWSFRLADGAGRPSQHISGECRILPATAPR